MDWNLPEKLLDRIDSERAAIDAERTQLDTELRDAAQRIERLKNADKTYAIQMRAHSVRALRGMKMSILLDNELQDRWVVAGPENAMWFAVDSVGREAAPQIYLDDVIDMSWGPRCA